MKVPRVTPIANARASVGKRTALREQGSTTPETPASPTPTEVPPSAPPEAPSETPVELPQPDAPPQPASAPQPQAMTVYVRFLRRRKTWVVPLPKRSNQTPKTI